MAKKEEQALTRGSHPWRLRCLGGGLFGLVLAALAMGQGGAASSSWVAPCLPGGEKRLVYSSPDLVTMPKFVGNSGGFSVAKHPPTVIFSYLPGQDHPGRPWASWGAGTVIKGKFYAPYGDHDVGTYIAEWDPETGASRLLVDTAKFLNLPNDQYKPGKIHSQLTLGKDGWLYYSTHNSGYDIMQAYAYQGDWIFRTRPETGKTEIVAQGPVGPASIPVGFADTERMIFFGGTEQRALFFAFDLVHKRLLYQSPAGAGPSRGLPYAQSTGRAYYRGNWLEPFRKRLDNLLPEADDLMAPDVAHPWGIMRRWDVKSGEVVEIRTECDPRASARESRDGVVWIADWSGRLWKLDVASETFTPVANLAVMSQRYITSLVLDSTGRYLYYCPGAHGMASADGTPILQYDIKTGNVKAICFLTPATLAMGAGYIGVGTYGLALSEDDSTLFATWNGFRASPADLRYMRPNGIPWDACAVTAIRIPAEERIP